MATSSLHLHDLLVSLLDLEDRAKEDLHRQAHPIAVARLLKGNELLPGRKISKNQRGFIKAVQEGKRDINEVYRSDEPLWFAYRLRLTQAKQDLAAPLIRDRNKVVHNAIETRRSPLNLALHELVIAGIGADENEIRDYLVNLNPFWGRGPDPSIAKRIADMHEKGVTNTILRKLHQEHPQLFKHGGLLKSGEQATDVASVLHESDQRAPHASLGTAAPTEFANPLTEVLVKMELAKAQREIEVTTATAQRLLNDDKFRSDILGARWSNPTAATRKDLTFNGAEHRELHEFACGKASFRSKHPDGKVHHAMVVGSAAIKAEFQERDAEDYIERGGSLVDWSRHVDHPLDEYVLNRIEERLSELLDRPRGALRVFIIRTIEGRAAKHEDVRSALDQLVQNGFANELLREVWNRFPIEAEILALPAPTTSAVDTPADTRQASTPQRGRKPPWRRLTIKPQSGGNDLAMLDGHEYRINSKQARFLKALKESRGAMVLGTQLTTACGGRADRIFNSLLPALQAIVERPGKGKSGYRLR